MSTDTFEALRELAQQIDLVKQGADAQEKELKDTSQPVGKRDALVTDPPEGELSKEQTRMNQEWLGQAGLDSGAKADANPEDPPGYSDFGSAPPGEQPEVEKDYEKKVKDPGTSHPARVDKEKTAQLTFKEAAEQALNLAHEILTDLAEIAKQDQSVEKQAQVDPIAAAQVGFEQLEKEAQDLGVDLEQWKQAATYGMQLAEAAMGQVAEAAAAIEQEGMSEEQAAAVQQYKEAAFQRLYQVLSDASLDADLVGALYQEMCKKGNADLASLADLAQASGAAESTPAEDVPAEEPADEDVPADVPTEEGDIPGAEPSEEEVMEAVLEALDEMGVDPAELLEAAEQVPEEEVTDKVAQLRKVARAAVRYKRERKEAGKRPGRALVEEVRSHLHELIGS